MSVTRLSCARKAVRQSLLILCILALASCANHPAGEEFRQLVPPAPGKGAIYITSISFGPAGILKNIQIDGVPQADFKASEEYTRVEVRPGYHTVLAPPFASEHITPPMRLVVKVLAGHSYFVIISHYGQISLVNRNQALTYLHGTHFQAPKVSADPTVIKEH